LLIMRMKAVEPPGGRRGTHNNIDREPVGQAGSSANEHGIGRCLSQLYNYFDVRRGPVEGLDLRGFGLLYGYGVTVGNSMIHPATCPPNTISFWLF